jgi:membrane protein insertase Oxa1/YidC/SpoIIIJ
MWSDLAALTPPLVVCAAFLIALVMFLRSQMSPKRRPGSGARRRPRGKP